jgi:glutathione peroxidase
MSLYDFSARLSSGEERDLADYRGKVLLVVNVASKCGFTPQYKGLQKFYERFGPRGLEILAFPCDQFGHQEPGSDAEIAAFCDRTYGVTFPLFAKIEVNGRNAHPLYVWLKQQKGGLLGDSIKWNFTKFLIDRVGEVQAHLAPTRLSRKAWHATWRGCCKRIGRDYSFVQAAKIPKAPSEIIVATISMVIGAQIPRFVNPTSGSCRW